MLCMQCVTTDWNGLDWDEESQRLKTQTSGRDRRIVIKMNEISR